MKRTFVEIYNPSAGPERNDTRFVVKGRTLSLRDGANLKLIVSMPDDVEVVGSVPNGFLIVTQTNSSQTKRSNLFLVSHSGEIIWRAQELEDLPAGGEDSYAYFWYEDDSFVVRSMHGFEFELDLNTGKLVRQLRFVK